MPFVKLVKNKAYFKRYQVKFRRRREGKTDYYARKRLVTQAKNKYNVPKYRFVVRFTNTDVICQIIYAKIQGDVVLAAAYSHELPRYGLKVGLTNWAAAYATGLLLARRVLTKLNLADTFEGTVEPDGSFDLVEPEGDRRPFKCFLDLGLRRATTGARVFAAMKGASDGGIFIPHSETRFPGYDPESKSLDSEVLRSYIFGGHVADYMRQLQEEDEEKYRRQFSKYIAAGITADDLEGIYQKTHENIRANPAFVPTKKNPEAYKAFKKYRQRPLTLKERRARVKAKKAAFFKAQAQE